jgi:hypothetical protein
MFPTISLHLHRLASRHKVRFEKSDPERVGKSLQFCVRSLPLLLNAERCNIFIYDPDGQKAWIEIGTGVAEGGFEVPVRSSLIGDVISSGRLTIANDLHDRRGTHAGAGPAADLASRNAICAPVRSRYHDEVIGVIEVLDKRAGSGFGEADAAVLEQAADCIRDLVDSVFLSQKVYGMTGTVVAVGEWTLGTAVGLILLGSLLTLLLVASLPSMHVVNDALGPLLAPLIPGPAR